MRSTPTTTHARRWLILLAERLKTPLQIGRYLVRAFEVGFDASVKPVDAATIESILGPLHETELYVR